MGSGCRRAKKRTPLAFENRAACNRESFLSRRNGGKFVKTMTVSMRVFSLHEIRGRTAAPAHFNHLLDCTACHIFLKSWNAAIYDYGELVGDLIKSRSHYYSEIYEQTADALELASEAKYLYDLHCKGHALEAGKMHLVRL
jgi:hypothetical protein